MCGGRLVLLNQRGHDVKTYPLADGLATIGSDRGCDIRLLLPNVSPHHATVVVHANQTVVSSITVGETLVNGVGVSVCALQHGDVLAVGGRSLRWEYDRPVGASAPGASMLPALPGVVGKKRTRSGRQPLKDTRATMPASTSSRQVAIVQPQRRQTTNEQYVSELTSVAANSPNRARSTRHGAVEPAAEEADTSRQSAARSSPKNVGLNDATKASLWIESRKTPRSAPRALPRALPRSEPRALPRALPRSEPRVKKSTSLRLALLRKAQSAHKIRVTKIQDPSKIDHTKQAAIMRMTGGHTHKARPSFVVKRPSPVRPKSRGNISGVSPLGVTPKRSSPRSAVKDLENGSGDASSSIIQSPILSKPTKSALKKSSIKKTARKTESIKFDLSNLEPEDRPSDVILLETTGSSSKAVAPDEDIVLRYSDSSRSPSPRPMLSRSSRIMEKSLGETYVHSPSKRSISYQRSPRRTKSPNQSQPESPRHRKSSRGSFIVDKALESFDNSERSRRTTKSFTDQSYTSLVSTRKTASLSPHQNLESFSIVDLVSMDSSVGSDRSVYGSAGSEASTAAFATPRTGRSTRVDVSSLLTSRTPYADKSQAPNPSPNSRTRNSSQSSIRSRNSTVTKRRSASLTTPENSQTGISINSTRVSRVSRSRSRINDSVLSMDDDDPSPKSSRRISKASLASPLSRKAITITDTPDTGNGINTPENRQSPEEATTPVLSIQNLLERSLSQSSMSSQTSQSKSIGGTSRQSIKTRSSIKSSSLTETARRSLRAQKTSVKPSDASQTLSQDEEITTPKSGVKLIQEAVKNKHSSAKKPQSKRSIIDNLDDDESDFVKQLFNSPVKRKLSRSMTEFSRTKLFEDDHVAAPTDAMAATDMTPDNTIMEHTEAFTPDVFVSPLITPENSPNLTSLKRLFQKSPENNPRARRSIRNDLTDVEGVKRMFGRSPRNSLSDVRVKEMFAQSPKNDLKRVSGVKSLFRSARKQKSPKNTLEDVNGVKALFKNSGSNDLRNVSGLRSVLRVRSPRNKLSDVRGVKELYREPVDRNNLSDLSGVEELFHKTDDLDSTFDQLIGKPPIRSYTKSKSFTKVAKPKRKRNAKSLHDSISLISENVEEWLEKELQKCVHKDDRKSNLTRELQKLTTDTVEGSAPLLIGRSRNGTMTRSINVEDSQRENNSTHTVPIKKRSLVEALRRSNVQRLPIKKRVVLHSTPVKGKLNVTMNASELGRVSPIANVTAVLSQRELLKSIRDEDQTKVQRKLSHKEPTPRKSLPKTSLRASRTNTRNKNRASLVISKKKPILSPKTPKDDDKNKENPIKTRSVRQTTAKGTSTPRKTRFTKTTNQTETTKRQSLKQDLPRTPKNTRAKAKRNSVVIAKPSTQLKPKQQNISPQSNDIPEVEKTVKPRRNQKVETVPESNTEEKQTRRTRNARNEPTTTVQKPKGKTVKQNVTEGIPKTLPNRRGRNVTFDTAAVPATNRRQAPTKSESTENTRKKNSEPVATTSKETATRRGLKRKVTFQEETLPPRRGKNVQSEDKATNESKKSKPEATAKKGKKTAEDTVKGGETSGAQKGNERVVGRTRNKQNSRETVEKKKIEVATQADSSRGRRNRNATVNEPPVENDKKVAAPAKDVTKRGGRPKKAVVEATTSSTTTRQQVKQTSTEVAPEQNTKPTRRKGKVDTAGAAAIEVAPEPNTKNTRRKRKADTAEAVAIETPPKRARATRAAVALVEPAVERRTRRR